MQPHIPTVIGLLTVTERIREYVVSTHSTPKTELVQAARLLAQKRQYVQPVTPHTATPQLTATALNGKPMRASIGTNVLAEIRQTRQLIPIAIMTASAILVNIR